MHRAMKPIFSLMPLLGGALIVLTSSCATPCKTQSAAPWSQTAEEVAQRSDGETLQRSDVQELLPPQEGSPIRIQSQGGGYVLSYRLDDQWNVQVGYRHHDGQRTNAYAHFPGGTPADALIGPLRVFRVGEAPTNAPLIPPPL